MIIMNALVIRDTINHTSDLVEEENVLHKTYIIENSLNQSVTLQWTASANADFSNSFNLGGSLVVLAGENTYASCSSLFSFCRVSAICTIAPASGSLTIHVFKYTGS